MQGHLEKYESAWQVIVAEPSNREALSRVQRCLAGLLKPSAPVQQMHAPPIEEPKEPSRRRIATSPFRVFSPIRGVRPYAPPPFPASLRGASSRSQVAPLPEPACLPETDLSPTSIDDDDDEIREALKREKVRCFYLATVHEQSGVSSPLILSASAAGCRC